MPRGWTWLAVALVMLVATSAGVAGSPAYAAAAAPKPSAAEPKASAAEPKASAAAATTDASGASATDNGSATGGTDAATSTGTATVRSAKDKAAARKAAKDKAPAKAAAGDRVGADGDLIGPRRVDAGTASTPAASPAAAPAASPAAAPGAGPAVTAQGGAQTESVVAPTQLGLERSTRTPNILTLTWDTQSIPTGYQYRIMLFKGHLLFDGVILSGQDLQLGSYTFYVAPGATYYANVYAYNPATSEQSQAVQSGFVESGSPTAYLSIAQPANIRSTSYVDSKLRVEWDYSVTGGFPTKFRVQAFNREYVPVGELCTTQIGSGQTSGYCDLTLTPGSYLVNVVAVDDIYLVGEGDYDKMETGPDTPKEIATTQTEPRKLRVTWAYAYDTSGLTFTASVGASTSPGPVPCTGSPGTSSTDGCTLDLDPGDYTVNVTVHESNTGKENSAKREGVHVYAGPEQVSHVNGTQTEPGKTLVSWEYGGDPTGITFSAQAYVAGSGTGTTGPVPVGSPCTGDPVLLTSSGGVVPNGCNLELAAGEYDVVVTATETASTLTSTGTSANPIKVLGGPAAPGDVSGANTKPSTAYVTWTYSGDTSGITFSAQAYTAGSGTGSTGPSPIGNPCTGNPTPPPTSPPSTPTITPGCELALPAGEYDIVVTAIDAGTTFSTPGSSLKPVKVFAGPGTPAQVDGSNPKAGQLYATFNYDGSTDGITFSGQAYKRGTQDAVGNACVGIPNQQSGSGGSGSSGSGSSGSGSGSSPLPGCSIADLPAGVYDVVITATETASTFTTTGSSTTGVAVSAGPGTISKVAGTNPGAGQLAVTWDYDGDASGITFSAQAVTHTSTGGGPVGDPCVGRPNGSTTNTPGCLLRLPAGTYDVIVTATETATGFTGQGSNLNGLLVSAGPETPADVAGTNPTPGRLHVTWSYPASTTGVTFSALAYLHDTKTPMGQPCSGTAGMTSVDGCDLEVPGGVFDVVVTATETSSGFTKDGANLTGIPVSEGPPAPMDVSGANSAPSTLHVTWNYIGKASGVTFSVQAYTHGTKTAVGNPCDGIPTSSTSPKGGTTSPSDTTSPVFVPVGCDLTLPGGLYDVMVTATETATGFNTTGSNTQGLAVSAGPAEPASVAGTNWAAGQLRVTWSYDGPTKGVTFSAQAFGHGTQTAVGDPCTGAPGTEGCSLTLPAGTYDLVVTATETQTGFAKPGSNVDGVEVSVGPAAVGGVLGTNPNAGVLHVTWSYDGPTTGVTFSAQAFEHGTQTAVGNPCEGNPGVGCDLTLPAGTYDVIVTATESASGFTTSASNLEGLLVSTGPVTPGTVAGTNPSPGVLHVTWSYDGATDGIGFTVQAYQHASETAEGDPCKGTPDDGCDLTLPAGTYDVVVTATESASGFTTTGSNLDGLVVSAGPAPPGPVGLTRPGPGMLHVTWAYSGALDGIGFAAQAYQHGTETAVGDPCEGTTPEEGCDLTLPAGTYDVIVTATESATGFTTTGSNTDGWVVSDAPATPTGITATNPVGGVAHITWSYPASTKGISFAVRAYVHGSHQPAGDVCGGSPTPTEGPDPSFPPGCEIAGLPTGVYDFEVTATDAHTTFSATGANTTGIAITASPATPGNVTAVNSSPGVLHVTWTYSGSTDGVVFSVKATPHPSGSPQVGEACTGLAGPDAGCDLTLPAGLYDIFVTATDTASGFHETGSNPSGTQVTGVAPLVAVTDVVAAPGDVGEVVVSSWSDPNVSGSVTGYTVTATPTIKGYEPVTLEVDASATSVTLTGAVGGVTYTVTVTAHGADASAPASDATKPVLVVGETAPPSEPPPADQTDSFEIVTPGGEAPAPGSPVTITGTGFEPFTLITVTIYSEPIVLGTTMTDENGDFSFTLTVPPEIAAGDHQLLATGIDEDGEIRYQLRELSVQEAPAVTPGPTVTPSVTPTTSDDAGLAVTGGSMTGVLVGGWAMLTVGFGLVGGAVALGSANRRRRRHNH